MTQTHTRSHSPCFAGKWFIILYLLSSLLGLLFLRSRARFLLLFSSPLSLSSLSHCAIFALFNSTCVSCLCIFSFFLFRLLLSVLHSLLLLYRVSECVCVCISAIIQLIITNPLANDASSEIQVDLAKLYSLFFFSLLYHITLCNFNKTREQVDSSTFLLFS